MGQHTPTAPKDPSQPASANGSYPLPGASRSRGFEAIKRLAKSIPARILTTSDHTERSPNGTSNHPSLKAKPTSGGPTPPINECYTLSHVEDDHIKTTEGKSLSVFQVRGMELTPSSVHSFAGLLNALEFPIQILVRQHSPSLTGLKEQLAGAVPPGLPDHALPAVHSLQEMLTDLETRPGVLDRRFYVVVDSSHEDPLLDMLLRLGFNPTRSRGHYLRSLVNASALGKTPTEEEEQPSAEITVHNREVAIDGHYARSAHIRRWPRELNPGHLSEIMSTGLALDLALHINPITRQKAVKNLEDKLNAFISSEHLAHRQGRSPDQDAVLAVKDILEIRNEVHSGLQRLFKVSLIITVHAHDLASLEQASQTLRAQIASHLAESDPLPYRQRAGLISTMPINLNALFAWQTLDTTSVAYLFPFYPPDIYREEGTLHGIDQRSYAPVIFDQFSRDNLNANVAILATSGAGKSYYTKDETIRDVGRGIIHYIIDPAGEYAHLARALGGRVITPGSEGQGLNPFVMDSADKDEVRFRIANLIRFIETMVREKFTSEQIGDVDHALTTYYEGATVQQTGFHGFFRFLEQNEYVDLVRKLRPFATGSLRYLLTDQGADLLEQEALVTVFDLHLLEQRHRPIAAMACAQTIWAVAARQPRFRKMSIDEVWQLMLHEAGAEFVLSMAKEARKYGLSLNTITQDIQDLLGQQTESATTSPGRALVQNASFAVLLNQAEAAVDQVVDAFNLTPDQRQHLITCPRGEGLLVTKTGKFPFRVEATPEEHALIEGQVAIENPQRQLEDLSHVT